ncbi:hypothetical protein RCH21_000116 [Arthrobacter sp. PL16]|nr:hypothetical protein [Arthrobacter sp. PL16]
MERAAIKQRPGVAYVITDNSFGCTSAFHMFSLFAMPVMYLIALIYLIVG